MSSPQRETFYRNLYENAQQDKYRMRTVLQFLLGASTTGAGIYAIIIASNNQHDNCLKTAHVGKLNLVVMIIIYSVFLITGGIHIMCNSTETLEKKEARKNVEKEKTKELQEKDPGIYSCVYCCITLVGLFFIIAYIITLTGTCINDNTLLFGVGLGVFFWSLVTPIIVWILNTCYALKVNIETTGKQIAYEIT